MRQYTSPTLGQLLFIMFLTLEGCGTGGHLLTKDQVAQITVGVTTKQDVRAILGDPKTVYIPTMSNNGSETWLYTLAKYASDPHTGVAPIGVDSFPITRAHRKTTEIAIIFDQEGTVTGIQERVIK